MKRTAKRDRRSQRKSQKRNTMRRAVRKSQRKSQKRNTMRRTVRKSQRRNTMRRKTKINKRTKHTGGMKGLEKARQTIGKRMQRSYGRHKSQRTESKNRMNKEERLKLLGQINALSQSLKLSTDAELDQSGISVLHKALRDLQKKLLDHDTRGITPYDEIQIALGAAGDVAMDSFREGRTALANKAGEQGQVATQAAAVAASEFFRRMNDMWGSLRSTPEIERRRQLMIEDRPQPPQ